jgi:chromosome segregation ATPase
MLQKMAEKVQAEGEAERNLYQKFNCYCTTNGADLAKSISDNQAKAPQTQSDIEAGEAEVKQLKIDLKSHQDDRSAAKEAMGAATAQREKEHSDFVATSGEYTSNIEALNRAIPAIEKGMAGGFLQASSSSLQHQLRQAVSSSSSATEYDRQTVLAFLEGGRNKEGYIPKSGEITGILKEIKADFDKNLADVEAAEADAVKLHEELIAAKTKQVQALSDAIEKKMSRAGDLQVEIVNMKNDLTDTEAALLEDQKLAAELEKGCATKKGDWEERQKVRADELVAIHDTIKILNDDDALDMFKKTLGGSSLLQLEANAYQLERRALARLQKGVDRPRLDFLALALSGKKVDFTKVTKMIDDMVGLLAQEQQDDDQKKTYCEKHIDLVEDKGKEIKKKVDDLGKLISDADELISTYAADIKALEEGINELDKSVTEATENRKREHDEFTELMSSNAEAKQLLGLAKNRLHKFYNPALYKGPTKKELTQEEKIYQSVVEPSFVQVVTHHSVAVAQPATWDGSYATKSAETNSVVSMLDLLIRDLTKEMTVAETEEKIRKRLTKISCKTLRPSERRT